MISLVENQILSLVKTRLQIDNDDLDDLISSYILEIGYRIKHYCNITEIPNELLYVWTSMVIDALKVEQSTIDEISDNIDSGQSVKIGDTSVGPAKSDGITSTSKRIIDNLVLNYKTDLNAYRKLRW